MKEADAIAAAVLATAFDMEPARGTILHALAVARQPLHMERLCLKCGLASVSVLQTHICAIRPSLPAGGIICRDHCYWLTSEARAACAEAYAQAGAALAGFWLKTAPREVA